jgi:hypothetical protein
VLAAKLDVRPIRKTLGLFHGLSIVGAFQFKCFVNVTVCADAICAVIRHGSAPGIKREPRSLMAAERRDVIRIMELIATVKLVTNVR